MSEVQETLSPGAVIHSRYLIVDLLGKGGFSAVYLVKDLQGEENFFALKEVIITHKQSSEHFSFEYSLLERLGHPALPRVHQVFANEEHNRLYMIMDYIEGPNLETLRNIQHEKRFSLPVITSILAPVVDAIAYLHQQHPPIVHRDIKPSNIIVPIVERKTLLVDFGIAKEFDRQGTTSAVRYGSHGYGAPEQYSSGTNMRTDIYGLGATLYTLLTGEVPADALDRMTQLSNDHPDPFKPPSELVPSLPLHVSRAIGRAMSINMMQRFATVQELWQAFQGESGQPPLITDALTSITVSPSANGASGKNPPQVERGSDRRSRKSFLIPIILAVLLVIGIGASYLGLTVYRGIQTTGSSPKSSPHPTAIPTATPVHYPLLATSYTGTLVADPSAPPSMTLTHIKQNNGHIIGFFSGLNENEPFSGLFNTQNQITLIIAAGSGHGPLSFQGYVLTDGGIQGTFCTIDLSDSSCIPGASNGGWNVTPA